MKNLLLGIASKSVVLLLVAFSVFIPKCLRAQVNGFVRDSAYNLPVYGLLVKARLGTQVLNYAYTDTMGWFKLTIPDSLQNVELDLLSMTHQAKRYIWCRNAVQPATFYVTAKQNALSEIRVSANKAVVQRVDTVSFRPESFADGAVKSVEDLLKKLPGFKIDAHGDIRVFGQSIATVLLNGENLTGGNYQMVTRGLSADVLESVQLLNNYSENPVWASFERSGVLALNLVTKPHLAGSYSFDAMAGLPTQHYARIKGLALYGPSQVLAQLGSGSVAGPSDYDYKIYQTDKAYNIQTLSLPESSVWPFSANERDKKYSLNEQFVSGVGSVRLSPNVKLKFEVNLVSDTAHTITEQYWRYILPAEEINYTENTALNRKEYRQKYRLALEYTLGSKAWLLLQTQYSRMSSTDYNLSIADAQNLPYTKIGKQSDFVQLLHLTNRVGQHAIADSYVEYRRPWSSSFAQRRGVWLLGLTEPGQSLMLNQSDTVSEQSITAYHALLWKLGSFRLGYVAYQHYNAAYYPHMLTSGLTLDSSFSTYRSSFSSLNFKLSYQKNAWSGKLVLGPNLHYLADSSRNGIGNQYFANLLGSARFAYSPEKGVQYSFTFRRGINTPQLSLLPHMWLVADYRTLRYSGQSDYLLERWNSFYLRLGQAQYGTRLVWSLSAEYRQRNNKPLYDYKIEASESELRIIGYQNTSDLNFSGSLDSYVHRIRSRFELLADLNSTKYRKVINSDNVDALVVQQYVNFRWNTVWIAWPNFVNELSLNRFSQQTNENWQHTSAINWKISIRYAPTKRLRFLYELEHMWPDLEKTGRRVSFQNAVIEWERLKSPWLFKVQFNNLTNEKYYENSFISDFQEYSYRVYLKPRFVMVGVSYTFSKM